ncbi:probable ATP-dependent RNA helicase DDX43 [Bacillus rossius redtenbacheri]|uniref:probable ATP-dependent RNA helicase DDX43 n=1 Tax=Bacillus rossius redtenbacheri TaxID=93214 RepID=UPI002FDD1A1E
MSDGWVSEEDSSTPTVVVRSQTFGRGRGRGGRGRDQYGGGQDQFGGGSRRDGNWRDDSGGNQRNGFGRSSRGDDRNYGGGFDRNDQGGNFGGGRGGGGYGRSERSSYPEADGEKTNISVQSSSVGRIIGKGGAKIRELESESGARIQIDKAASDEFGATTTVVLTGSEECRSRAKGLIEELLEDTAPRGGYGGAGGSGGAGRPGNAYSRPGGFGGGGGFGGSYQNSYGSAPNEDGAAPKPIDWNEVNKIYEEAKKDKWSKLPPLKKDFYVEDPDVANMSKEEVEMFRQQNNNISVGYALGESPDNMPVPNPVQTFEQCFRDYPEIMEQIRCQGFVKPSPIQCQAWPVLMKGLDLIGIAQTGTGKTLAFLLPAMIHIDNQPVPREERGGPNVLVLAPTRELALQIEGEVKKYHYRDIKCVCVYGGGSRRDQVNIVTRGVEIVIATPGRLNDLVNAGVINISAVTYLVLDEADRMLDMGFEPQIRKSLLDIRPDRQTIMTSATWPEGVRRLAQSYMKNPIQVYVGSLDLAAVHSVTQRIELVTEDEKIPRLQDFLYNLGPEDKVIVFVGKKARADDISSDLVLKGVDCQSIHGDREQSDREQALADLKSGSVRILIATDVASRGIDIEDVTHIFNVDFPRNVEEYVHRVGRTGRAGKTGEAISLVTREDWGQAGELIKILEEANQEVPEELYSMSERFSAMRERRDEERRSGRGGGGGGGRFGGRRGGFGRGGGGGRGRW